MTLARALRRAGAVSMGALAGVAACVAVGAGLVDGASLTASPPALGPVGLVAGLLLLVIATMSRRLGFAEPSARSQRASFWLGIAGELADVEVCLALVAAGHAVVAVTGGADSSLYPLLYAIVAFAVTLASTPAAVVAVLAAIGIEVAVAVRAPQWRVAAAPAAIHVAFFAGAAAAHGLLLRGLARRLRQRHTQALARSIAAEREAARDYRLIAAALGPSSRAPRGRDEEERLLAAGGARMVGDAAAWILATLKQWLGARTVALVWLDSDGERLKLREVASEADDVTEKRVLPAAGVLGAVVRDRAPLLVAATKAGQLPYYEGRSGTGAAFVGVPVLEGPHLRGVLCADRDRPFDEADRDVLAGACGQIVRTVQSEHVFRAVERSKYEYERFYQAAALLGRALTPEQVMETAFDAAAAIVEYDAAVIALYERETQKHRVASVRIRPGGEGVLDPGDVSDLEFKDNAGLAAMVVKNRHYLPAGGEPREVTAPVYTRKVKLAEARSLLVLPLLSGEEAIGTFTLAARAEKRFGKDVREMLAVIGNQVAVSLENGLLYKKMETMATTDGLTGLTNHRTFQERFANLLERAGRHGQKLAVLLCDVDHFKKVNDTYGHPVGDEVLRRVAKVLGEVARKIDVPARYGGEEFAVILDGAEIEQARQVAERIRQEVARLVIESDKGPFQVTMSIGVAGFPDDGRDRAALIEHSDHALYHAKHSGRNQVVTYPQFVAARAGKGGMVEPPPNKQRKAS